MSDKPEDAYNLSGMDSILQEDKERANKKFTDCVSHQNTNTIELRLKRTWTPPRTSIQEPCWILASATPNLENGELTGVLGCVTDISSLKWAEQLQINTAEAAKDAKRRQERFVDMVSHEIRNPLNAMLQCADDICRASQFGSGPSKQNRNHTDILASICENSQTILFCAAHQKRIIDDVLTISKLDSSLLTITPVLVEPLVVARQALQIFEAELSANDIASSYIVTQSYIHLNINWVYCDPSRVTQILINLLTIAIKFTKSAEKRKIDVRIGASTTAPLNDVNALKWFPSGRSQKDATATPIVCSREKFYLNFEVQDSGKGISLDEMTLLFSRFSQANPKTNVQADCLLQSRSSNLRGYSTAGQDLASLLRDK